MKKFFYSFIFLMVFIYPLKADIVVSNWDGYSAPDIMETFESATGVKGEMSFHATNEEIMGKVTASKGAGYDVLFVSSPFAEALDKMGLLADIDHSKRKLGYSPKISMNEGIIKFIDWYNQYNDK